MRGITFDNINYSDHDLIESESRVPAPSDPCLKTVALKLSIFMNHSDIADLEDSEYPSLDAIVIVLEFNFAVNTLAKRTLKGFLRLIIISQGRCRFSASGNSTDLDRDRTRNLGCRKPVTNQLRYPGTSFFIESSEV
ncbi:hypothetical protein TNCV_2939181 [Trichonephila clavipes]|nr:hypothetical protein TNCV_2939181 [Trichonephila clavipes]